MGPRAYPAETEALGFVLDKLRHSLERLVLSSDAAPYRVLAAAEWPRLRMLELRGDAPIVATCLPSLLSVLERMFSLVVYHGSLSRFLPRSARLLYYHCSVYIDFCPIYVVFCTSRPSPWPDLSSFRVCNAFYSLLRHDVIVLHSRLYVLPASTQRWVATMSA